MSVIVGNSAKTSEGLSTGVVTKNKYTVALKFINKLLVNIGKDPIDDLTKFVNIDREDIIKDINKKTFEEMEYKLFRYYDKAKCGWYRRKVTKNYILSFLRYMCDENHLRFVYDNRELRTVIDGKNYRKSHMLYSIKQSSAE